MIRQGGRERRLPSPGGSSDVCWAGVLGGTDDLRGVGGLLGITPALGSQATEC